MYVSQTTSQEGLHYGNYCEYIIEFSLNRYNGFL